MVSTLVKRYGVSFAKNSTRSVSCSIVVRKVAVESEEVIAAKVAAERASSKPLYQQLAEIKEKKQQEYDENTKKIFAPPKVVLMHTCYSYIFLSPLIHYRLLRWRMLSFSKSLTSIKLKH